MFSKVMHTDLDTIMFIIVEGIILQSCMDTMDTMDTMVIDIMVMDYITMGIQTIITVIIVITQGMHIIITGTQDQDIYMPTIMTSPMCLYMIKDTHRVLMPMSSMVKGIPLPLMHIFSNMGKMENRSRAGMFIII